MRATNLYLARFASMRNAKVVAIVVILSLAIGAFAQTRPHFTPVPKDAQVKCDIKYASAGEVELKLDLYLPKADAAVPLVIFIHGGGWQSGDKRGVPILALLTQGYAVASINYRLTDVAPFPAQIYDCKAAIRFLRAHADDYGLDAKHFGAVGVSAGGHLVALLGTSGDVKDLEGDEGNEGVSSSVQAVIDCFGPTQFSGEFGNGPGAMMVKKLLGNADDPAAAARRASPVTYVTADDPPFFISHGAKDPLVPVEQAYILNTALQKAGVATQLYIAKDAGHGAGAMPPPADALAFLNKYLKGKTADESK